MKNMNKAIYKRIERTILEHKAAQKAYEKVLLEMYDIMKAESIYRVKTVAAKLDIKSPQLFKYKIDNSTMSIDEAQKLLKLLE